MSKDGYLGLDTVSFHWSSILNVMYGFNQKLFEGLFLHDKRFEGWWKRLEKHKIDQSTHFFYSVVTCQERPSIFWHNPKLILSDLNNGYRSHQTLSQWTMASGGIWNVD